MTVRPHTPYKRVAGLAVLLTVAVSLLVLAFSWTSVTSSAKDIPLDVSGPAAQVRAVSAALEAGGSDTFVLTTVDSRAEAVERIENRTALGAVVLDGPPEILTTSAGSPIVSQLLATVAAKLGQQEGAAVTVTDVVPLADTDPRGAGLSVASFPLVLMGLLGGVLFSLIVAGTRQRIAGVVLYSVVGGLAVTAILQPVLQILQGDFLVNAAAIALSTLGTAAFVLGLHSLLGQKGIPLGAITLMFIANPISAATQPAQFLVGPWGAVGQWFVPGSSATLLRDLSYFPDAASLGFSWSVVAVWALAGIALTIAGGVFRKTHVVVDVTPAALEPVAA